MSTNAYSKIGDIIARRYRLVEQVGEGGFSKVFRAISLRDLREVAIKLVNPNFDPETNRSILQRFYREALLTSALTHPNTLTPIDYGRTNDGIAYIVMTFLHGSTVSEVLDGGELFSIKRTHQIIVDMLQSLEEAHSYSIIHSDIKTANIFLEDNKAHARMLDFGVATIVQDAESSDQVFGTPHYLAPEVALGRRVRPESDIYSLGITAWEMLYGTPPFEASSVRGLLRAQISKPFPRLSEELYSTRLGKFIRYATAKSAGARPTATEALEMLKGMTLLTLQTAHKSQLSKIINESLTTHSKKKNSPITIFPYLRRNNDVERIQRGLIITHDNGGGIFIEGELGIGKRRLIHESLIQYEQTLDIFTTNCRTEVKNRKLNITQLFERISSQRNALLSKELQESLSLLVKKHATLELSQFDHDTALLQLSINMLFLVAHARPLVWVITELEYADDSFVRFVIRILDLLAKKDVSLTLLITLSTDQPFACRTTQFLRRNITSGVWNHVIQIVLQIFSKQEMHSLINSVVVPTNQVMTLLLDLSKNNPGRLCTLLTTGIQRRVLLEEHGRLVRTLRGKISKLSNLVWNAPDLDKRLKKLVIETDLVQILTVITFLGEEFNESTARQVLRILQESIGKSLHDDFDRCIDQNILVRGNSAQLHFLSQETAKFLQTAIDQKTRGIYLQAATTALEKQAKTANNWNYIGNLYLQAKRPIEASFSFIEGARLAEQLVEFAFAEQLYTKALERPWVEKTISTRHSILLGLARTRGKQGAFEDAIQTLKSLLKEKVLSNMTELNAHITLAKLAAERGDMGSVAKKIQRIMLLAKKPNASTAHYVDALLVVGDYALATGNRKQAARAYVDAERRCALTHLQTQRAQARIGIARCLARDRKLRKADRFLTEAINYLEKTSQYDLLVQALIDRGNIRFSATGTASQEAFDQAIQLAQSHNRSSLIADILVGQARVMQRNQQTEAANILLMRALERYRQLYHTRGEAKTLRLLAECAIEQSQNDAATTYIKESLSCYRSTRDVMGSAQAYIVASEIHWVAERFEKSAADAERAVKAYRALVGRYGETRALLLQGRAYAANGDKKRAEVTFFHAEQLAKKLSNTFLLQALEEARSTNWNDYNKKHSSQTNDELDQINEELSQTNIDEISEATFLIEVVEEEISDLEDVDLTIPEKDDRKQNKRIEISGATFLIEVVEEEVGDLEDVDLTISEKDDRKQNLKKRKEKRAEFNEATFLIEVVEEAEMTDSNETVEHEVIEAVKVENSDSNKTREEIEVVEEVEMIGSSETIKLEVIEEIDAKEEAEIIDFTEEIEVVEEVEMIGSSETIKLEVIEEIDAKEEAEIIDFKEEIEVVEEVEIIGLNKNDEILQNKIIESYRRKTKISFVSLSLKHSYYKRRYFRKRR